MEDSAERLEDVMIEAARWAVDFLMVGIGCFSEGPAISWDESAAMLLRWREAKTDG